MINNICIDDLNSFKKLGLQVNNKFDKLFDLGNLLNSDIDYLYGYYNDDVLIAFIHIIILYETMDVINIVVDEKYRNQEIGTKLLNYVVDKHKDINNIMLEVRDDNKIAINFYYKNGFELINRRKKYYGDCDALILKRDV